MPAAAAAVPRRVTPRNTTCSRNNFRSLPVSPLPRHKPPAAAPLRVAPPAGFVVVTRRWHRAPRGAQEQTAACSPLTALQGPGAWPRTATGAGRGRRIDWRTGQRTRSKCSGGRTAPQPVRAPAGHGRLLPAAGRPILTSMGTGCAASTRSLRRRRQGHQGAHARPHRWFCAADCVIAVQHSCSRRRLRPRRRRPRRPLPLNRRCPVSSSTTTTRTTTTTTCSCH